MTLIKNKDAITNNMQAVKEQFPSSLVVQIIAVILLILQAFLIMYISWQTSPNRTEIGHFSASVYVWQFRKFDVFQANPPLIRLVSGLPEAFWKNLHYDWSAYSNRPQDRCEWPLGNLIVSTNNIEQVRTSFFVARLACLPFVLLGGYFGFRMACEIFGGVSGLLFLTLWTFSPLILGWGATICPDVAAASMGTWGLYSFRKWLKLPLLTHSVQSGTILGLMCLTKLTWIIAFPLWLILYSISYCYNKEKRTLSVFKQFILLLCIAVFVINMGYFFDGTLRPLKDYSFISTTLSGNSNIDKSNIVLGNRFANLWIGRLPVPLPSDFVLGFDTQRLDFERGFESYVHGHFSEHGWWWYYFYVCGIKLPLGVLLLVLMALVVFVSCPVSRASACDEMLITGSFLFSFIVISSQTGFSLHSRYIIPVLPLIFLFISRLGGIAFKEKKLLFALVIVCTSWSTITSLFHYPHSLSYFNELAGSPRNWPGHLLGSNIDWGQDLYELENWYKKNKQAKPLYISCDPTIPLYNLGIEIDGHVPQDKTTGWFVVSVNELYNKECKYCWLKTETPVAMAGYSIWIYYIPP